MLGGGVGTFLYLISKHTHKKKIQQTPQLLMITWQEVNLQNFLITHNAFHKKMETL